MYAVYAGDTCIYDDTAPDKSRMAVSPKFTLSAGAAGSLTLTLPVGCAGYDTIQRLTTTLRVERDGSVIWVGRVLSEDKDFYNSRVLFCEGALAYLNDTIPMIANPTLGSVLTAHNAKVAADRQIATGTVAYGGVTADADGSKSLDIINSKLVGALGGVLRMRYPTGAPTLDWLSNYPAVTGDEQRLEFGENLLDFTRHWDMSNYSTYCYVRGHKDEDTGVYAASGWVTLSGDPAPATLYGRIETYLDYNDLETDAQCIAAAQAYLATQQFAEMTLEVTALDLHILNPEIKSFDLLERVHVSSWAHGLDADFAVTGLDIPLDDPGNTRYTLGYVNVAYVRRVNTLTQKTRQDVQETAQELTTAFTEADGVISARVEEAEGDITELNIAQGQIESRVSTAEGNISTVTQTANEIKAHVSRQDGQGNTIYNTLTIDAQNGVHIANETGTATNIDGGFLDADTINVNRLYGNVITFKNSLGGTSGAFYIDDNGPYGPEIQISFAGVNMNASSIVYLPSPANVYCNVNGTWKSLTELFAANPT